MSFSEQAAIADFTPKGYFVEYPFLMDAAVRLFIDSFQDSFVQKGDKFVLRKTFSRKNLKDLLLSCLSESVHRICSKRLQAHPEYKNVSFIVAASGIERREKTVLLEPDIDIGIDKIDAVFQEIFDELFLKKRKLDVSEARLLFLKHSYLASYNWKKILEKKVFGRSNFVDATEPGCCLKEIVSDEKIKLLSKR